MRKMLLTFVVALAVAAPAQAGGGNAKGRELKISGPIVRLSEQAVSVENAVGDAVLTCAVSERVAEKVAAFDVEKQAAAGPIVELDDGAIVVQSSAGRLACRVPEEKQGKLEGLKLGDKVKILCADGVLAGLERYEPAEKPKPAGEEARMYGVISALSRTSVTVQGEAGSLSCAVPAGSAEKVAGRFAVGDRVKIMCRGSELTYLEQV